MQTTDNVWIFEKGSKTPAFKNRREILLYINNPRYARIAGDGRGVAYNETLKRWELEV
jgi:hypothetical protein